MRSNIVPFTDHPVARQRAMARDNAHRAEFEQFRRFVIAEINDLIAQLQDMQAIADSDISDQSVRTLRSLANVMCELAADDPRVLDHCDEVAEIVCGIGRLVIKDAYQRAEDIAGQPADAGNL